MGTGVISQGARGAVGMFFLYGVRALQPVPPLDPSRGMASALLMAMAIVLWLTVEFFDIYFRRLDPTKRIRGKSKPQNLMWQIVFNLVQQILIALGMASTSHNSIVGNSSRRRRRRG